MMQNVFFDEQMFHMMQLENEKLKQEHERFKIQFAQNLVELKRLQEEKKNQEYLEHFAFENKTNLGPQLIRLDANRQKLVNHSKLILMDHNATLYNYQKIFREEKNKMAKNIEGTSVLYNEALEVVLTNDQIQVDFVEEQELKNNSVINTAIKNFKQEQEIIQKEQNQANHEQNTQENCLKISHYREQKQQVINALNTLIQKICLQIEEQQLKKRQTKYLEYSVRMLKTQAKQLEKEFQLGEIMLNVKQIQEQNQHQFVQQFSELEKEVSIKIQAPLMKEKLNNLNSKLAEDFNCLITNQSENSLNLVKNISSENLENQDLVNQNQTNKIQAESSNQSNNEMNKIYNKYFDELSKELLQKSTENVIKKQQPSFQNNNNEQSYNIDKIQNDLNLLKSGMVEVSFVRMAFSNFSGWRDFNNKFINFRMSTNLFQKYELNTQQTVSMKIIRN